MDGHHHAEFSRESRRRLKIALILVVAILGAEVAGGLLSNSLALLGDAGHMLVDALALGMSLFAIRMAARPATPQKTYGYHRVEIMAALANGIVLCLVAAFIFYEAYQRFGNPPEVRSGLMLIIAVVGLAANIIGVRLLGGHRQHSLNVRAAYWHVLGDMISSIGVIVAAVIITVTGQLIADPIIAIVTGGIILWGAVKIVRESVDILMEAAPRHIALADVVAAVKSLPDVEDMHDVHLWTITTNIYALSAHLAIRDQSVSRSTAVIEAVNEELARRFNITHTTLQLECENCPGGVCSFRTGPDDTPPADSNQDRLS